LKSKKEKVFFNSESLFLVVELYKKELYYEVEEKNLHVPLVMSHQKEVLGIGFMLI